MTFCRLDCASDDRDAPVTVFAHLFCSTICACGIGDDPATSPLNDRTVRGFCIACIYIFKSILFRLDDGCVLVMQYVTKFTDKKIKLGDKQTTSLIIKLIE
ncbi:hypothetical protein BpHYR1_025359 [Brachionus plicatilis]|uniref:Uncharacterized protein n=1 Tax=Brachionus plicatilis TaxID=10195 RepID=A0A3M7RS00_BRAPC|nr:hypothetical protein BpHYR1_025359 [Brachionus plicatilis]